MSDKSAENEGEDLPRDLGEYNGIVWRPHKNADGQAGQNVTSAPSQEGHAAGPACSAPESKRKAEVEPVAWMNPDNGVVIDAKQKIQVGVGYNYPNFSVPLYTHRAHPPALSAPDDDAEVLFTLEMSLEHDERHQALALRTWMPRIRLWANEYIRRSAGKEKENG